MRLILDAHLDLAWNALSFGRDLTAPLGQINQREAALTDNAGRGHATTAFPEMRRGAVAVCFGTLMARARPKLVRSGSPPRIDLDYACAAMAYGVAQGQLAYYRLLERQGELRIIGDSETLKNHWRQWQERDAEAAGDLPIGLIVAMEGAGPIVEPSQVGDWHRAGLRCLNLVHYGSNCYASGTGDSGPLTAEGKKLLAEMRRVNMILDTTHLSDPSFFDALDHFDGPVIASHQNCRELVPGERQFSDRQIRMLLERDGVLGVMFDALMLCPTWRKDHSARSAVNVEAVVDHVDHICQLAGDCRHVAIGSDLDGGFGTEQCPEGLDTIADLQRLEGLLLKRGYSDQEVDAIFHGNWLRFLATHLPHKQDSKSPPATC